MLTRFALNLVVVAAAFAVTAAVIPGFELHGGVVTTLWVAFIFGLVNAIIGPLLRFVSLPLTAMTFGLFTLVINGLLVAIVAGISDKFDVGRFWWTIVGALLLGIVAGVFGFVVDRIVSPNARASST
jgi:putative membrane protein